MPQRLGQHFLSSRSILAEISQAVCRFPEQPIIEIGPGKGALTGELAACARHLIAIELDQVLVHYLREKFKAHANVSVLHDDALRVDMARWGPVTIAGNLPYYITSPLVEKALRLGPLLLNAIFLVQREVAERMSAKPGTREFGYFSVLVQTFAEPEILRIVPPGAFRPPPKVDSAIIRLTPRTSPLVDDVDAFLRFASLAFRMKRKTLRNNLAGEYAQEAIDSLAQAKKRAEQLSPAELAEVHQRILKLS